VSYTSREVKASIDDAFSVLVDPETYPSWLLGAAAVRAVDDAWPARGSRFHHTVGFGPLRLSDSAEVVDIEYGSVLSLKVRARPFISAFATFRVLGCGDYCVITLEEEPALRTIGNLVRPVMDPVIHVRNHRSLRKLAALIEQRAQAHAASPAAS
jgi:hypothetical protein